MIEADLRGFPTGRSRSAELGRSLTVGGVMPTYAGSPATMTETAEIESIRCS